MTVAELIKILEQHPKDSEVLVECDDGWLKSPVVIKYGDEVRFI